MWELNVGRNEFGLAAGTNHDLRNECVNSSQEEFEHKNVWLGDTGASAHMSWVKSGFKSLAKGNVKMCFVVNGDEVEAEQMGEWKGRHHLTTGKGQFDKGNIVSLSKVLFIPTLRNNLFILTAEMARGAELTNKGNVSVLKMPDSNEIVFDHLMDSKLGYVAGAVIRPLGIDVTVDKDDLIELWGEFSFFEPQGQDLQLS